MKVSVVVPVYNVQKYLRQCIDSILGQTYTEFEVILVDDGSTDDCPQICDEYCKSDQRIKVIHKKNGGLSDARNCGIDHANGEYICFIDSDDIVATDYIGSMLAHVGKGIRIASCGYCYYYDSGKKIKINYENIRQYYKGIEAQKYLNIIGYFNVSACNKLFKKSLFDEIRFPVGKKSEDWYVMYKLIEKAGGIYYNSDIKYFYRQRNGSITKSTIVNDEAIDAALEVYNYYLVQEWNEAIPYAAQSLAFANVGVYNAYLCGKVNKKAMQNIRENVLSIKEVMTLDELSRARKIQMILFIKNRIIYDVVFKIFDLKRKINK